MRSGRELASIDTGRVTGIPNAGTRGFSPVRNTLRLFLGTDIYIPLGYPIFLAHFLEL
jgi:hypothetical protein